MEDVNVLRYLEVNLSAEKSIKDEVNHRNEQGQQVGGAPTSYPTPSGGKNMEYTRE